jgi:hypothetical protein
MTTEGIIFIVFSIFGGILYAYAKIREKSEK